ncbi:MAG: type II secretion system protein GspM [Candidatus Binataceae bacterium]
MLKNYLNQLLDLIRKTASPRMTHARSWVDPFYAQAKARYERMEPRERILVQIAAGFVGILILYNFLVVPVLSIRAAIDARVESRRHDLREVHRLTATYKQLKIDLAAAERRTVPRNNSFSLFSVVESTLTKDLERERVASITPGPEKKIAGGLTQLSVELKLTNVTLKQLVDLLYDIKTLSTPVGISAVHVARGSQETHSFDVDITCIALKRSG